MSGWETEEEKQEYIKSGYDELNQSIYIKRNFPNFKYNIFQGEGIW